MKKVLGNSCAKGCLIYVVALVAIVAATGFGLDGLKGRFNIEAPKGSLVSADGQAFPPGDGGGGGVLPTPTSALPPPVPERPQPLPTITAIPTLAPGNSGPGVTVQFTPVSGQGGVISGEASAPFYIVQSGDTLSEIALRFGVDVETLRQINNLPDDIIQPGQVLYLPQPQQARTQPQPAPTLAINIPNTQPQVAQPTVIIPQMPNTGIIRR